MAIEIRELVVRATVTKNLSLDDQKAGLDQEVERRLKKEILKDCKNWMKGYMRDLKSR